MQEIEPPPPPANVVKGSISSSTGSRWKKAIKRKELFYGPFDNFNLTLLEDLLIIFSDKRKGFVKIGCKNSSQSFGKNCIEIDCLKTLDATPSKGKPLLFFFIQLLFNIITEIHLNIPTLLFLNPNL